MRFSVVELVVWAWLLLSIDRVAHVEIPTLCGNMGIPP